MVKKEVIKNNKSKKKKVITNKVEARVEEILNNEVEIKTEDKKFKLEGIDYVPYVIGWVLGVFNLIFWVILLIVGLASENKHRFIDYTLHKFVYIYGIVMIILILLLIFILVILLMLGITLFGPLFLMR